MENEKSKCCNANVRVCGGDSGRLDDCTMFFVCDKCKKACDVKPKEPVETKQELAENKPAIIDTKTGKVLATEKELFGKVKAYFEEKKTKQWEKEFDYMFNGGVYVHKCIENEDEFDFVTDEVKQFIKQQIEKERKLAAKEAVNDFKWLVNERLDEIQNCNLEAIKELKGRGDEI